jgi:hypothetical protein
MRGVFVLGTPLRNFGKSRHKVCRSAVYEERLRFLSESEPLKVFR